MTRPDIDAIAARAEAATPGPWACERGTIFGDTDASDGWDYVGEAAKRRGPPDDGDPDGVFIAHARTDIPALLAEVRRLREGICEMIPYLPFGSTLEEWYPEAKTWPEPDLEAIAARADADTPIPLLLMHNSVEDAILRFRDTLEEWCPEALTWPEVRDLESPSADYLKKETD